MATRTKNARPRPSHIMKGDKVRVIRGNYRDQEGTVLRVLREDQKVVVEGVNVRKKHMRPNQQNPDGGIISMEMPIHVSNVMLLDSSGNATRVRAQAGTEEKERISVKDGKAIARPQ